MAQLLMLDEVERVVNDLDKVLRDGRLGRPTQQLVDDVQERIIAAARRLMCAATGGSTNPDYDADRPTARTKRTADGGIMVY